MLPRFRPHISLSIKVWRFKPPVRVELRIIEHEIEGTVAESPARRIKVEIG